MDRLRLILFGLGAVAVVALVAVLVMGGDDDGGSGQSTQAATTAEDGEQRQDSGGAATPSTNDGPENFGTELTGAEREEVVSTMNGYFAAMQRDPAEACPYISTAQLTGFKQIAQQLPKKQRPKTGCEAFVTSMQQATATTDQDPVGDARRGANSEVLRVGVEGDSATILLRTPDGNRGYLLMVRADDEWTVAAPTITPLSPP